MVETLDRQLHRLGEDLRLDSEAAPPTPFMEAVRARGAARAALRFQVGLSAAAAIAMIATVSFLAWPSASPAANGASPPRPMLVSTPDPDHHPTPATTEHAGVQPAARQPAETPLAPEAGHDQPLAGQPRPTPAPKPE